MVSITCTFRHYPVYTIDLKNKLKMGMPYRSKKKGLIQALIWQDHRKKKQSGWFHARVRLPAT
jgi:hypothetical protein